MKKILFLILISSLGVINSGCDKQEVPIRKDIIVDNIVFKELESLDYEFSFVTRSAGAQYYNCKLITHRILKGSKVKSIEAYYIANELNINITSEPHSWDTPPDSFSKIWFDLKGLPAGEYKTHITVNGVTENMGQYIVQQFI